MADFHNLKISDVTRETAECVSFAFDIPENLSSTYKFIQGQYITLKLHINGEELRRCYSVCASPSENELRVAAKRVVGGRASTWLNEKLKVGDEIEVMPPMGNFHTPIDVSNKKTYVLFAGGSGVTPILSILKTVLEQEPNSNVVLFYGNLNESAIIFRSQIDRLTNEYNDRLKVYHILDQPEGECIPEFNGVLSSAKTTELVEKYVDSSAENEYFLCGPPGMKDGVLNALNGLPVDQEKIHVEVFTVDTSSDDNDTAEKDTSTGGVACAARIIMDGDEYDIEVPEGEVVLQAAMDADLDPPYSCRGGMCMTCRAKLEEGEVEMEMNYALTDKEVAKGYILTCQAKPKTPTITVNYDAY